MPLKHIQWITGFITVLLVFPIIIGLVGTLLPAFHYFPPLGEYDFSLSPWRDVFSQGEFYAGLKLTLITGIGAPVLALWLALSLLAWGYQPIVKWTWGLIGVFLGGLFYIIFILIIMP